MISFAPTLPEAICITIIAWVIQITLIAIYDHYEKLRKRNLK